MKVLAKRVDGRKADQLRPMEFVRNYTKYAGGSVLVSIGATRVLCTAYIEQGVPEFLEGKGKGWLTAEYGMLPSSTRDRKKRSDRPDGRAMEIRRLVGRSLRAALDLNKLGERTVAIDCDVIQADGGTRTASVTGAYVALVDAVNAAMREGKLERNPIVTPIAAVSAGVVDGQVLLDLNYAEDSTAEVDFNVVMTGQMKLIEVQGTAEGEPFDRKSLDAILKVSESGIRRILAAQKAALAK